MKSRLLSRLDADIVAAATRPIAADCLRCERAAYLARLGDGASAASELDAIQRRHAARPNASISAWLNFAEAVVGHYGNQAPQAHDRMKRAHALATAAGVKALQALSAAWLAHFAFMRAQPVALARHAAQAQALAADDHHAARARASLVVAQSYHQGGRFDRARPWYERAHRHATTEGDDTTLSAIMWNMTSLRVAAMHQLEACGPNPGIASEPALASADSTIRFDGLIGVRSLSELAPIVRARLLTLLGRTAEALPLFETHLAAALTQGFVSIEGSLLADRAWCRWRAGNTQGARDDAVLAEKCLQRGGPSCDLAPGHSRLVQVCDALGDAAAAKRQGELAARAWGDYRRLQAQLIEALGREFEVSGAASA